MKFATRATLSALVLATVVLAVSANLNVDADFQGQWLRHAETSIRRANTFAEQAELRTKFFPGVEYHHQPHPHRHRHPHPLSTFAKVRPPPP